LKIPIKVLLAEDHTIVRNGIVALLENEEDIKIIGDVRNGNEILKHLESNPHPDVILTDLNMPDLDGIELIQIVKAKYPHIKVLVLTMMEEDQYIINALDAGAYGYLLKSVNIDEIIFAIKQIVSGQKYIYSGIAIRLLMQTRHKYGTGTNKSKVDVEISKREVEILGLIAQGYTNNEIADKLTDKTYSIRPVQEIQLLW